MKIDADQLATDIIAAMRAVLTAHWQKAAPYAEAEAKKLAICAAQIEAGYAAGTILQEEVVILRDMQASAARAALTSITTIGAIAAQDAINAALKVLSTAVNTAVKFPLL